jgi:hypothetical protein
VLNVYDASITMPAPAFGVSATPQAPAEGFEGDAVMRLFYSGPIEGRTVGAGIARAQPSVGSMAQQKGI